MPGGRLRNNSRQVKFIIFAFANIVYSTQNLIMINIQKTFYNSITPVGDRKKNGHLALTLSGVEMRKYLEYRGVLLVSPLYSSYRSIRPLCKTPSFPSHESAIVRLLDDTLDAVTSKTSWMANVKYQKSPKGKPRAFPF